MQRVLLTGASSYLGLNIARRFQSTGAVVHALVRPRTDLTRLRNALPSERIHVHDGSPESLDAALAAARPDLTIHLASRYTREARADELHAILESNVTFGVQLLDAHRRAGRPTRILNAGTHAQYFGSRLRPLNLYAACKQAFQDILCYYADAHDCQFVSLILFDVYGCDDWRPKFLARAVEAATRQTVLAIPEPDVALDLVHINDVVDAFMHAGDVLTSQPGTLHGQSLAVSTGTPHFLREIVTIVERLARTTVRVQPGAYQLPARRVILPWRGSTLPGWQAKITVEHGIRELLEHRRAMRAVAPSNVSSVSNP